MNQSLFIRNLFDLNHTAAASLLEKYTYPWEALPEIGEFIRQIGPALPENEYEQRWSGVWIHRSARLYPNCYIGGPCIIGANTEVRPGAFIRANALVGKDCVVGNSTELKITSTVLSARLICILCGNGSRLFRRLSWTSGNVNFTLPGRWIFWWIARLQQSSAR